MMRIGIVTGEYPPTKGGVGAYSALIADTLATQGHTVHVFTNPDGQAVKLSTVVPVTNSVAKWTLPSLWRVKHWAAENQLDIVNIQYQTAAFGMSPFIHFLPDLLHPLPTVTTFHDLRYPYLFPKAGRLREWIVKRLAHASNGVIVTNHEDAAQLVAIEHKRLIPIGSNIMQPVSPSFDRADFRTQAGIAPDDFIIGYFGFSNRSKGMDTLLQGAAQLRGQGIPVRVVLIGGTPGGSDPTDITYQREIDALAQSLDMENALIRTGYIEASQVAAWFSASDAIALPFRDGASFRRGTLMAAIRYGCAIITTQPVVPIPEFMDGENMMFHPIDDPAALADRCRSLIDFPSLREKLRHGALALSSHFRWEQIAAQTAEFFDQVRGASA